MPIIGDIAHGSVINKTPYKRMYRWVVCPKCGYGRWLTKKRSWGGNYSRVCNDCSRRVPRFIGAANHNWKGGRSKRKGYFILRIYETSPFFKMATKAGVVLEHRLIMAQYLNRCLLPWEVVHHKNGVKDDNRIENLELLPHQSEHVSDSALKRHVKSLEIKVHKLEKELNELQCHNQMN